MDIEIENSTCTLKKRKENGKIEETKDIEEDELKDQENEDEFVVKNEKNHKRNEWLCLKDMPEHLQFNPNIKTGYRPLQSPLGCFKSAFQWHNESVNIITHAIPIFYIIYTVPEVLPWHSKELTFLAWCHIAGILCPWLGSFVYHMFMNLNYGPLAYYVLLQIDMLGIWVSQSFGALPLLFSTSHCLPDIYKWSLISCYCLLSIWGLYKAMLAWSPWDRRLCFLLPFLYRIGLWFLRISGLGGGDPAAFLHVILQDVVSIAGGCIGAIHVPEKWFPGSVDLCLNSHNIMHVLVVAAVWSMHQATVLDLHWMAKHQCSSLV
ncbi:progestin and adipoQ receptor family member 4 [Sitophilus oryzae]|uniref:Progestin and adipoQ receptor family member 4 n=1 Tax=Sitophilus oryzae TaxID=7048 RepID=A0A6J2X6X2_SITOR|nr:progestin and adipoQ receptor family member 4 [Sitophilus oryzae]